MNKSESITELAGALAKAQDEFPVIAKTKEVIVHSQKGSYTFKYAPLENMLAAIRPVLATHGLALSQGVDGDRLETLLTHTSGQWLAYSMPIVDPGTNQQYGAGLTYRRRYSIKMILGIESDEDNSEQDAAAQAAPKKAKGAIASGPINPMDGARDNVAPERKEIVSRIAGSIIDLYNADQKQKAYEEYKKLTDTDEKMFAWSYLSAPMRRAIKELGDKERSNG